MRVSKRACEMTNLEKEVSEILEQLKVEYVFNYSTRVGFVLDFYLPKYNGYIEVDGPTHDTPKRKKIDRFRKILNERTGLKELLRIHWYQMSNAKKMMCEVLGIVE